MRVRHTTISIIEGGGPTIIVTRSLGLAVVVCVALVVACAAAPRLTPVKARKLAPDFTLKDANGSTVHLSDYRGKVVLLDFWATWCTPCQVEIPWFIDFERSLKGRGLAVVGVSMDEDGWDAVKPYIQKRGMNYRVLLGDEGVAKQYGGLDALPTTLVLDRDGRIAATHMGLSDKREFLDEITTLLDSRSAGNAGGAGSAGAGAK